MSDSTLRRPLLVNRPCWSVASTTSTPNTSKWAGSEMDRKSPLMSLPLMSWQTVIGITRSTLTWSTHPGESTSKTWSRSKFRSCWVQFCQWDSDVFLCWSRSGEKISCKVEHASLSEPLITDWGKYLSVCSPAHLSVCSHAHLSVSLPVCPQTRPCLSLRETRSPSERQDWFWVWSYLWLDSSTTRGRLEVRPVHTSSHSLKPVFTSLEQSETSINILSHMRFHSDVFSDIFSNHF